MQLSQLLNSIRYGDQVVEEMTDKEFIISNLDEDTSQLITSKQLDGFIKLLSEGIEDSPVIGRFNKIKDKFIDIEEKIADGKRFSPAYSRMKFDSINEDYNKIVDLLGDRRIYKQFNNKVLSKTMATIQYGIKDLNDRPLKETNNALLNTYIKEDVSFIENIIE